MKKFLSLGVILSLALWFICCRKVNQLTQFDINYTNTTTVPSATYTASIPGDTISVPVEFDTPQIPTESANKFNAKKPQLN